jgi:hypothetical protein
MIMAISYVYVDEPLSLFAQRPVQPYCVLSDTCFTLCLPPPPLSFVLDMGLELDCVGRLFCDGAPPCWTM